MKIQISRYICYCILWMFCVAHTLAHASCQMRILDGISRRCSFDHIMYIWFHESFHWLCNNYSSLILQKKKKMIRFQNKFKNLFIFVRQMSFAQDVFSDDVFAFQLPSAAFRTVSVVCRHRRMCIVNFIWRVWVSLSVTCQFDSVNEFYIIFFCLLINM